MSTNKAEREEEVGAGAGVGLGGGGRKKRCAAFTRTTTTTSFSHCLDVTPSGGMCAEHRRRDAHMPLIGPRSGVVGGILVRRKDGM